MSQVWFHAEPNDNLYKRVDVVISEFCENSLKPYMELVGFTHLEHTIGRNYISVTSSSFPALTLSYKLPLQPPLIWDV